MTFDRVFFAELSKQVLGQLPPEDRVSEADGKLIQANADRLIAMSDDLTQAFYESLYGHPATQAIFREGERPMREESLRDWWERSVRGPFDEDYWAWQAYVGLLHVKRKVKNPMMLGHAALVTRVASSRLTAPEDQPLREAISRLMATVSGMIAYGYEKVYVEAIGEVTGQEGALIDRTVEVAVQSIGKLDMKN